MAKKKTKKTIKNQMLSPIAFKRASILFASICAVISFNVYVLIVSPAKKEEKEHVISQMELMNVLGTNVSLGDEITETYAPFMNKPEIKYWYDILQEKPDYRDAHIILASYAYNDHNCQLAQSHIQTAYNLDPTDIKISDLMQLIEVCNE